MGRQHDVSDRGGRQSGPRWHHATCHALHGIFGLCDRGGNCEDDQRSRNNSVVERFAAMGAPWTYGISDVGSLADNATATTLEYVKVADLHRSLLGHSTARLA